MTRSEVEAQAGAEGTQAVPGSPVATRQTSTRPTRQGAGAAPRARYLRPTAVQLLVLVPLVTILWTLGSAAPALSFACGAACALVPQGYFALRMQRAARQSAAQAARLGLVAEGGKFLLSAVAFALVFAVVKPAQPGMVFLGFGVLWLIQLVDSIRLLRA